MDRRDFVKSSAALATVALLPIPAAAADIPNQLTVEKWFVGIPLLRVLPGSLRPLWINYHASWLRIDFMELREGDVFRMFNPDGTPHYDDYPWNTKIYHWRCECDPLIGPSGIPSVSTIEMLETAPGLFETVE